VRLRYLSLSPWRRAPLRLLSIPSLFLGVVVAAFVLGLSAGSRPVFVSSAASGSLQTDIDDGCRFAVGLKIERTVDVPGAVPPEQPEAPAFADASEALDAAVAGAPGLDRNVTLLGQRVQISAGTGDGERFSALPIARDGYRDHIQVITQVDAPGVWVPDILTDLLHVQAGDLVTIDLDGGPVTLPVAGTYVDLARERDSSWCSLTASLDETRSTPVPPPALLFDQAVLFDTLAKGGVPQVFVRWEYAPTERGWTLDDATQAERVLQRVSDASNNAADPLAQLIGGGRSQVDSVSSLLHAQRTSATVSSAAGPIALATAGVALLVLLTAARSWLDRRRREVTVLALRGAGPLALAVKAVLEMLLPMLLGAAGGLVASLLLVREVGPSTLIEGDAIRDGIVQVGLALLVAIIASAVLVTAAARRVAVDADGAAPRQRLLWWEPAVLLLAGAALYELHSRGSPVAGHQQVDSLALLFPFLLLAGGAGLLARACLGARTLGAIASRLPTAGWLAARRLRARRLRAVTVVSSAAVAVGIVVFAGSMSASIRATAEAKALLPTGAEQVIRLALRDDVPPALTDDGDTTVVTRQSETGVEVRGHPSADVLGVDPSTFADGAFWDPSFADSSLSSLLGHLDDASSDGALNAIAVGDGLPDRFVLYLPPDESGPDVEVEVQVTARAEFFPGLGLRQDRPLVVLDRADLAARGVNRPTEIWTSSRSTRVIDELEAAGITPLSVVAAGDITSDSDVRAQLWTVSYLELIGLAAGLVTVAGLGLYFAASLARIRLGSAVAQRLGMKRRTSAFATVVEVGGLVGAGWLFGSALSWLATRLTYTYFDPDPNAPPNALMRFGWSAVLLSGLGALVVAVVITVLIERGTAHRSLQRMLRDTD
jgi:putative ABC transport system permease protein